MKKLQLCYPLNLPFGITQKFGENQLALYKDLGMKGHNGWDLSAPDGTPVYATHDGTVVHAGLDGSNGLLVVIKTDEKFEHKDGQAFYKTLYGHLKTGSIIVTAGQKVKAGEKIAEADNTGMSTGSHLHFGLKPVQQGEEDWKWWNVEQDNGYNGAIDPAPYFNGKTPQETVEEKKTHKTPYQLFLAMQEAIRDFQLSVNIPIFKGKPLSEVAFGPDTRKEANKFMTKNKYK